MTKLKFFRGAIFGFLSIAIIAIIFGSNVAQASQEYTGTWVSGEWGECNATCGGGEQTRTVTCTWDVAKSGPSKNTVRIASIFSTKKNTVKLAIALNCNESIKPSTTQACNTQACSGGSLPPEAYMPPAPIGGGGSDYNTSFGKNNELSGGSTSNELKVVINNDDTTTNNEVVNLNLIGGLDAKNMVVSEDSTLSGLSLIPYTPNMQFTLSAGDGLKTIYAKFFTSWGQASPVVSDSINLQKRTTPQVLGVKLYPDGSLLRSPITQKIYFIIDGKKKHIENLIELWEYRNIETINVSEEVLAQYPDYL